MPTRVNTRFVIILSSVLVLIVGAFGALYYLKVMRSPEERIRQAETLLAQGDYRRAAEQFGRAIARRPGDMALLDRYAQTIAQVEVRDRLEAQKYLAQMRDARRQKVEFNPGDAAALEDYLGFVHRLAKSFGGGLYQVLQDQANARLQQDPDNLIARRYRGIARTRLINAQMPRDQQMQAGDDLIAAHTADPQDMEVAHHLAQWLIFEADRLEAAAGSAQEVAKLRDQALEMSRRMLAVEPDSIGRQIYHLESLRDLDKQGEARSLVADLEAQLLAEPRPLEAVVELAETLPQFDQEPVTREDGGRTTRGLMRAEALLDAAVEAQPDVPIYHALLGQNLVRQGRIEEASERLAQASEIESSDTALDYERNFQARMASAFLLLNLDVSQVERISDPEARTAELKRIEDRLVELEKALGGAVPQGHLVRGKLAMTRREWNKAIQHLDRANEAFGGTNLEAASLSARARRMAGERGAAAHQLEQVVAAAPTYSDARVELVGLYTELRQFEDARRHLEALNAQDPNDARLPALQLQFAAASGDLAGAIAGAEKIDPEAQPQFAAATAQLYLRAGRRDEAHALLTSRLDSDPSDLRALMLWLGINEDADQRTQRIAAAREAGADEATLTLIEAQASGAGADLDVEAMFEKLLAEQDDPVQRELAQVAFYRRTGDDDKAAAALDRAAQLQPDHPQVLELQFEAALADQRWEAAERLAARAGQLNLDLANGAFYRARLFGTQQKLDEAAAEYRRGLGVRPVFSEGWRQLGEVLGASGQIDAAADAFQRAIDQRPDNVRAIRGLASVADRRGEHARALELLRSALRFGGGSDAIEAYLRYEQQHGDPQRALELRQRIADQAPQNDANRRAMAILQANVGQHAEAMKTIEGLIADQGMSRENAMSMAAVHAAGGDADAGRAVIEEYLRSRGEEASVDDLIALARYDLARGDFDATLQGFDRARAVEGEDRRATRELADLLFAAGRAEEAIPHYRSLHAENPDDVVVSLRLAETLMRAGQIDEAKQLVAGHPGSSQAHVLKGIVALREDDRASAIRAFEEALRLDPTNAMALVQLAMVLGQDPAQVPRAKRLLTDALRNNPEGIDARLALAELHLRLNETSDAVRELGTVLEAQPNNDQVRLRLVQLHQATGNATAAVTLLQDAQRRQPEDPRWPRFLAQVLTQRGDMAGAVVAAKRLTEIAPGAETLAFLTDLQIQAKRPQEALATLETRQDLVNIHPLLQALRGRALAAAGRADEARNVFARAIERAGARPEVAAVTSQMVLAYGPSETIGQVDAMPTVQNNLWVQLNLADLEIQNAQYAQALSRLEAVSPQIGADQPDAQTVAHRLTGLALYQSGKYEAAREVYEKLLQVTPEDVGTLNNLAYLLAEDLDRPSDALPHAERAAALAEGNMPPTQVAQVLDTLGWTQAEAGQLEAARSTLERSVSLEPLAPNLYHLAVVHQRMGQKPQALEQAERAIRLAESSPEDEDVLEQARALMAELTR